ncbi:MAG: hypothetical protein U0R51_03695 [Solirubrobacterales bacterium]
MRPRLTYANVVATLALVLAMGGGTVYAAIQLGKDDVKSRNIAPGAVQSADLSPKVLKGLDVDVTGSAKSGAKSGINTNTAVPVKLKGKTKFKPKGKSVAALAAEAKFTIATADPAEYCNPAAVLYLNGERTRVFAGPEDDGNSTTLVTSFGRDADGPFGLVAKKPLKITAAVEGDENCTPDSQLDRLEVRILQIR